MSDELFAILLLVVYLSQNKFAFNEKHHDVFFTVVRQICPPFIWVDSHSRRILELAKDILTKRKKTRRAYQLDLSEIGKSEDFQNLKNTFTSEVCEIEIDIELSTEDINGIFSVNIFNPSEEFHPELWKQFTRSLKPVKWTYKMEKMVDTTRGLARKLDSMSASLSHSRRLLAEVEKRNGTLNWAKRALKTFQEKTVQEFQQLRQDKEDAVNVLNQKVKELEEQLAAKEREVIVAKEAPQYAAMEEQVYCPICLDEQPLIMLVHGETAHSCCRACWDNWMRFGVENCPTCKIRVERTVQPFF